MRPFARGTKVLLTSIKPEFGAEHRLAHGGPKIIRLVFALGHQGLLGRGEAHEDEHSARHRALTLARRELSFTLVVTRSTTREVDARSGGVQPLSRRAAPAQAAMERRMR